jgi:hypothetical protein
MCYHALGHLAMYITGADIQKSERVCEKVSSKPDGRNYTEVCTEGIFMTLLYGADPEDVALTKKIKPTKENVNTFCNQFSGLSYQICKRESSSYFEDRFETPGFITGYCSFAATTDDFRNCVHSILNRLTDRFMSTGDGIPKMLNFCDTMPARKELCYWGFAVRLVQMDADNLPKSVAVCTAAEKAGRATGQACWEGLMSYGPFMYHTGSAGRKKFCSVIPSEWLTQCLERDR